MPPIIAMQLDVPGNPSLQVDLEDGSIYGLDEVWPHLTDSSIAGQLSEELYVAGEQLEEIDRLETACKLYDVSSRIAERGGHRYSCAVVTNSLGVANKRLGKFKEAEECYKRSVQLLEKPFSDPEYESHRLPS